MYNKHVFHYVAELFEHMDLIIRQECKNKHMLFDFVLMLDSFYISVCVVDVVIICRYRQVSTIILIYF